MTQRNKRWLQWLVDGMVMLGVVAGLSLTLTPWAQEPAIQPVKDSKNLPVNAVEPLKKPTPAAENTEKEKPESLPSGKEAIGTQQQTSPEQETPVLESLPPISPGQPHTGRAVEEHEDAQRQPDPFALTDHMNQTEQMYSATPSDGGNSSKKEDKETEKQKEKMVYVDLPAMVVFPVLRHGNEKAFGDVVIVFANEYANKLEKTFPNTRIHNPVYSVEQLKLRGLNRVYNQMMDYYIKAGRPEPRALAYLLDELANDGLPIARAIFIEADVDIHHKQRSYRPMDILKKYHSDALPDEERYYVASRIKVYDTSSPHHPMVWAFSWSHPVKTTGIYNVTPSVFQDSDSLSIFSTASRMMSRISMAASPKGAYRQGTTDVDALVAGKIYGNRSHPIEHKPPLNDQDRRTLERLLQNP